MRLIVLIAALLFLPGAAAQAVMPDWKILIDGEDSPSEMAARDAETVTLQVQVVCEVAFDWRLPPELSATASSYGGLAVAVDSIDYLDDADDRRCIEGHQMYDAEVTLGLAAAEDIDCGLYGISVEVDGDGDGNERAFAIDEGLVTLQRMVLPIGDADVTLVETTDSNIILEISNGFNCPVAFSIEDAVDGTLVNERVDVSRDGSAQVTIDVSGLGLDSVPLIIDIADDWGPTPDGWEPIRPVVHLPASDRAGENVPAPAVPLLVLAGLAAARLRRR